MKFNICWDDYSLVKITATSGDWIIKRCFSRSSRFCEIIVPDGINEAEVNVIAEFCNAQGEAQLPAVILQKAKRKSNIELPKVDSTPSINQKPKPRRKKAKRQETQDECSNEQSSVIAE